MSADKIKPLKKGETQAVGEDFEKKIADLVKSGMCPGKAVQKARQDCGVGAAVKVKPSLKPIAKP